MDSVTQPTAAPTRKVASATLGGAIATIVVWLLAQTGMDIPAGVEAAIATIVVFAAGYIVPERP